MLGSALSGQGGTGRSEGGQATRRELSRYEETGWPGGCQGARKALGGYEGVNSQ